MQYHVQTSHMPCPPNFLVGVAPAVHVVHRSLLGDNDGHVIRPPLPAEMDVLQLVSIVMIQVMMGIHSLIPY